MSHRVSVKPGHPTGSRRRSGQVFTGVPVEVESVTDEMRADPWLQIVEIPAPQLSEEERAAKEAAERREAEDRAAAEAAAKAEQAQHEDGTAERDGAEIDADDPAPRRGRKK